MGHPTAQEIKTATSALRTEAGVWDGQSAELAKIGPAVEALRMTRIEAGLFQVIVDAYEEVCTQVIGRANEGTTATAAIADTLVAVADTYDQEESENVHRLKNIY